MNVGEDSNTHRDTLPTRASLCNSTILTSGMASTEQDFCFWLFSKSLTATPVPARKSGRDARAPNPSSRLSAGCSDIVAKPSFRSHPADTVLHFKNVAVEVCDPLPALD